MKYIEGGMAADLNLLFEALFFSTQNNQYVVTLLVDEIIAPLLIDSVVLVG